MPVLPCRETVSQEYPHMPLLFWLRGETVKHFRIPILLFLLALLLVSVEPRHTTKLAALYDHPAEADSMVSEKVRSVQTFEKVYLVLTPFELSQRSTLSYRVSFVTRHVAVSGWTSPKEGRVHVERDTRRWHRAQRERRVW